MEEWVAFFDTAAPSLDVLGGKGANLCRMTQAGLPVPAGFVLTVPAYDAFVHANGLASRIDEANRAAAAGTSLPQACSDEIRDAFEHAVLPPEIIAAVHDACERMGWAAGATALAVRSSAPSEDSPEHSFAGQHESYLNVGQSALIETVKRCWSSLWSTRAIEYRVRLGLPPPAGLAVVIQQLVAAEASGVIFTANPVTGARGEAVVNAGWGFGELVVSGRITPDNYRIDKTTGALLGFELGEKRIAMRVAGSEITEEPVATDQVNARVLRDGAIAQLLELAQKVETLFGTPQDIEWCLTGDHFHLLQARPITALPEIERWAAPAEGRWIHGGGAIELLTEPVSPLFETLFVPIFDRGLFDWMSRLELADALRWPIVRGVNSFMYVCLDLCVRPRHLRAIVRNFREHMESMADWPQEVELYRAAVAGLSARAPEDCGSVDLCERVEALLRAALRYWIHVSMIAQPIYRTERRLARFCSVLMLRDRPDPKRLLRCLPMRPMEAERSTYELAMVARALAPHERERFLGGLPDHTEASADLRQARHQLAEHLRHFGHQIYSFDPLLPTLAEDPRPVLAAVAAYVSGKEPPAERLARLAAERHAIEERVKASLSPRRLRKFRARLKSAQQAAALRENALFEVGLAWGPLRQALIELGRRLAARQTITRPEDVFWLIREELRRAASDLDSERPPAPARGKVAERALAWRRRQGLNPPYILPLGSKPKLWWRYVLPVPELRAQNNAGVMRGTGVSPGTVTSVARVILSLDGIDRLNDGEVIVAHTTPPAWTPLFARAGGLVTDLGGPLAHGSIIAREYGIPAVMGTGSATHRIRDGERVTVDGTSGCVYIGATGAKPHNRRLGTVN